MTSSSEPLTIWKSLRTKPDGAGVEASSAVGESAATFFVAAVVVIVDGGMKEEAKLENRTRCSAKVRSKNGVWNNEIIEIGARKEADFLGPARAVHAGHTILVRFLRAIFCIETAGPTSNRTTLQSREKKRRMKNSGKTLAQHHPPWACCILLRRFLMQLVVDCCS